jgi:hypothetical protein
MKQRIIAIAVLLALAAGCKFRTSSTAHATALASVNGRSVRAEADGRVWIHPDTDEFTVKVSGHEIVIGKDRLLIDKNISAEFSATATNFFVGYSHAELTVTADGAKVLTTTLAE